MMTTIFMVVAVITAAQTLTDDVVDISPSDEFYNFQIVENSTQRYQMLTSLIFGPVMPWLFLSLTVRSQQPPA